MYKNKQSLNFLEKNQGVELKKCFQLVRKWWWVITVTTLLAAITGYWISTMLPPVYQASTSLLVKTDASTAFASEQLAATYKELLTKRPVIEAAARPLGLNPGEVEKKIRVRQIPNTSLIEMTIQANTPLLAMELANGIVTAFENISHKSGSVRTGRDMVVVEPAILPLKPVTPSSYLLTLLAAVSGLLLGTGAVFFIEYLNDTVKDVEDIHSSLSLPILTIIPRFYGPEKQNNKPPTMDNLDDITTNAYHILRTNIQLSHVNNNLCTLLVTTPLPSKKRDTLLTNLGTVMAQSGLSTLLIDANLRRPRLHKYFNLSQEPGLSTLLEKNGNHLAYISKTNIPNLHLLPGGPPTPDPLQLLSSPQANQLINSLKKSFDIVFINTPPVLIAAEAIVLASQVDGTILMVEGYNTRRQSATQAKKMLRNGDANILGVILTDTQISSSEYHYYSDFSNPGKRPQNLPPQDNKHFGWIEEAGFPLPLSATQSRTGSFNSLFIKKEGTLNKK